MKFVSRFSPKDQTILRGPRLHPASPEVVPETEPAPPEHAPEPESIPTEKPGLDPFAPEWPADRPEPRPKA